MGPTRVTVKSIRLKGRYKDTNGNDVYYYTLDIGGTQRNYNIENEACGAVFDGKVGQTFTVIAEGSRDDATVVNVGESGQNLQQPAARQAPPVQQQATRPPVNNPPHQQAPTQRQAPPAGQSVQALKELKIFIGQNSTVIRVALKASALVKKAWDEHYGPTLGEMPESLFVAVFTSHMYGVSNQGKSQFVPANIDLATLQPIQSVPRPQAPPPVQQAPTPTAAQYAEPAEPEGEPF
jgi:hypothetical protein